jgi:hypothetical protein
MNSRPPRKFSGLAIAIVVAALIIGAGIYASVYFGKAATSTQTSTITESNGPLFYTSGVSPEGLQLQVRLNSSIMQSHGALAAQIELLNTLNRNVSLAVLPNANMSGWDEADFLCSGNPSDSLVGFALFGGHFSAGNISAAGPPLHLAELGFYPPCAFRLGINDTTFLPNSDETLSSSRYGQTQQPSYSVRAEVNATTGYCVGSGLSGNGGSINCGGNSALFGYWNPGLGNAGNGTLASKNFEYFPSGEYTIVATDDWNQYVYAYFAVL